MIIVPVPKLTVKVVEKLTPSQRNKSGFGSTGTTSINVPQVTNNNEKLVMPTTLPATKSAAEPSPIAAAAAKLHCTPIDNDNILPTDNVIMSTNPIHNTEEIIINVRGKSNTLGLELAQSPDWDDKIFIKGCKAGSPARAIKNWIKQNLEEEKNERRI